MSVTQTDQEATWHDFIHLNRRDAYSLSAGAVGELVKGLAKHKDLEDIIRFDDPRDQVFEVLWARFNVFAQRGDSGEIHITHYEITTEDTESETVMQKNRDYAGDTHVFENTATGASVDVNAGGRQFVEDPNVMLLLAPHQAASIYDTASGTGAASAFHMAHEHVDFVEVGKSDRGFIMYPTDSINVAFEYIKEDSGGGATLYENMQLAGRIISDDVV